MNKEYECSILNINVKDIETKLTNLGAKKIESNLFKRYTYPIDSSFKNRFMRLRSNGTKTTLTIKDKSKPKGIGSVGELEFEVEDFDKAKEFLDILGYKSTYYQENIKIIYLLDNVEISIDKWPMIPAYIEIEGKNELSVTNMIKKLGFDKSDICLDKVSEIYTKYGINIHDYKDLCLDEKSLETRDLLDSNRNFTGEKIFRFEAIPENRFITTVISFIQNSKGEFLIQKANSTKKDGLYASTGGHPKSGESSIEGIVTEIKEELGLTVDEKDVKLFYSDNNEKVFCDLYYIKKDFDISDLTLQDDEVESVCWCSIDDIKNLNNKGLFRTSHYTAFEKCLEFLHIQF